MSRPESTVICGEDEEDGFVSKELREKLRGKVAKPVVGQPWRSCEAMVLQTRGPLQGQYLMCGKNPVERHHRLTRARGGRILDDAGELYHLMDCCHEHHMLAHDNPHNVGLLIDGYVTSCAQCRRPHYTGPDEYLEAAYGSSVHLRCVSDRQGSAKPGQGL